MDTLAFIFFMAFATGLVAGLIIGFFIGKAHKGRGETQKPTAAKDRGEQALHRLKVKCLHNQELVERLIQEEKTADPKAHIEVLANRAIKRREQEITKGLYRN